MMKLDQTAFESWLVDIRRELHKYPETAFEEQRTSKKIAELLSDLGIGVTCFDDITGVVGLIRGEKEGPTIALRSDIDALPIQEMNDVPYRSVNPGKMHACGHEASAAILLGTAKYLVDSGMSKRLDGNVKFIFQPAEEVGAGARAMIERGVLENPKVDRIIAGHMDPNLPVGQIGHFKRLGYASADCLSLTITGKGGHGASPDACIDPIVAGAHFISQCQSIIARNIKPTHAGVISIGKLVAGDVSNAIPETACLEGSIRALSSEVRALILKRLQDVVKGIEIGFQVRCELRINPIVPCLTNDTEVAAFLHESAASVLGQDHVCYLDPIMGSEDFSHFTEACPGAIMRFGCSNGEKGLVHPLHSPYFDIDESVLATGVKVFVEAIRRYLKK